MSVFANVRRKLFLGGYDVSGSHTNVDLTLRKSEKESTKIYDLGIRRLKGLCDFELSHDGTFSAGTGEIDTILAASYGSATDQIISVFGNTAAAGSIGYIAKGMKLQYELGSSIDEVFPFVGMMIGKGIPAVRGTVLANGAVTSTGGGTSYQLGAVSATQKIYAALHLYAVSTDDTITIKIQSDDNTNFTDPTDRITFTADGSAITAEFATPASGAITDTYWRAYHTISGTDPSFTYIVTAGIV